MANQPEPPQGTAGTVSPEPGSNPAVDPKDPIKQPPEAKPEPSQTVTANLPDSNIQNAYFINEAKFKQYLQDGLGHNRKEHFKTFSIHHTRQVTEKEERDASYYYQPDEETISELKDTLEQRRLLVLTGEPDQGKTATAIYLSHLLRSEQSTSFVESLLIHPLEPTVKIVFNQIFDNKKKFGGRMLIFRDAFSGKHRNILDFFMNLEKHLLEDVSEKLRNNKILLLFTADTATVDKDCYSNLSSLKIARQLPMLQDEHLHHGLERILERFALSNDMPPGEVNAILDIQKRGLLIQRVRTLPRIAQFIDQYLLSLEKGVDLNKAIGQFENLEGWFLRELAGNFEVWCFAFTLGLCQCVQDSTGVPWFEFEEFRRAISRCLAREFNIPEQRKSSFRDRLSEGTLAEECRAEVYENPDTGEHCVRFLDDRYPEMLWRSLLRSNRKLLTPILPQLKKMAESEDWGVRRRAAQILGRIGEIDPFRITLTLRDRWMYSRDYRQMATVGYLFEGILASQHERYRTDLLKELGDIASEEDKPEIWTAIAAYKCIGVKNLSLAMQRYREIAERKLVESMEDTRRIDRIVRRVEGGLKQFDPTTIEHLALTVYKEALNDMSKRLYDADGPFLLAIQRAIVSLCLECGLIPVLQELCKWMEADQKALSYIVTLVFLMQGGIADELERRSVELPPAEDGTDPQRQECSLLIASIASDKDDLRQMEVFLRAVFTGFSGFLTPLYRRFLRKVFFMHLKKWAEDSLPVKKCREAMEILFAELLKRPPVGAKRATTYKEINESLSSFITSDSDFKNKDHPLYGFALAVFARDNVARSKSL
jgi:hypothetical protein